MATIYIGRVLSSSTDSVRADQGVPGSTAWPIVDQSQLVPKIYDYIALGYTGDNITQVQYYQGGSSGTLVATLTLAYSGNNIVTVTRT